jgi:hypothetical protein
MRTAFLAVAAVLTSSIATATAEPAQTGQQMQMPPNQTEFRGSNQIRERSQSGATEEEDLSTATGADATATPPVDSEPEPESIGGGTEP